MEDDVSRPRSMTETEVAEILRCSASKIKRLRMQGLLADRPGRPVLMSQTDVDEYLDRVRVPARPLDQAPKSEVVNENDGLTPERIAEIQARARSAVLKRRLGPPRRRKRSSGAPTG